MTNEPEEIEAELLPVTSEDSDKLKLIVLDEFFSQQTPVKDIALRHGVDEVTVEGWLTDSDLLKQRSQQIGSLYDHACQEYKKFIAENRLPTMSSQLRTVDEMHQKLSELIRDLDTSDRRAGVDLERATRALKNLSDVATKIVAVSENTFGGADGSGPNTFIVMNASPRLPEG